MSAPVIAPHRQIVHLTLEVDIPGHLPREGDPHYALFNQTRDRLQRLGLLKCNVCGDTAHVELHHSGVEFCLANAIDPAKLVATHPDWFPDLHGAITDAEFQAFIEGPSNLSPFCKLHHTGAEGIHRIPFPWFEPLAWLRDPTHPIVQALNAGLDGGAVVIADPTVAAA